MKKKTPKRIVTGLTPSMTNELIVNQDHSPLIPQRSKLKNPLHIYQRPLNSKQQKFLDLAADKSVKVIFVSGPAGSSKTFLSVLHSLRMISEKRVSDLIYIRSAVESSDSKLGFLPGETDQKLAPYIQPLLDKLVELLPKNDIDILLKEERVVGIPVGFLRGLNWNAKVIIADEAQNLTFKELFTLITRIGEFSKVFILGDSSQSDINGKSGFLKMIDHFDDEESRQNGIHVFRFGTEDIVRSGLVRFIIERVNAPLPSDSKM
jgi:phosphate starvation-inducible protein PhoH and related proteins